MVVVSNDCPLSSAESCTTLCWNLYVLAGIAKGTGWSVGEAVHKKVQKKPEPLKWLSQVSNMNTDFLRNTWYK